MHTSRLISPKSAPPAWTRLHTRLSNCQRGISPGISNKHLQGNQSKTESLLASNLLLIWVARTPQIAVAQDKILGVILDFFCALTSHKPRGSVFAPKWFLDRLLGTISPAAATGGTASSLPLIRGRSFILHLSLSSPSLRAPESSWSDLVLGRIRPQRLSDYLIITSQRLLSNRMESCLSPYGA